MVNWRLSEANGLTMHGIIMRCVPHSVPLLYRNGLEPNITEITNGEVMWAVKVIDVYFLKVTY